MSTELLLRTYGQNIVATPEEFWEYKRLIGLPMNRSPEIGTRLDWSRIAPYYEVDCFQEEDWQLVSKKLAHSSLSQHPQVLMTVQPGVAIVSMTPAFFLLNLDDLMFYSRYSALVWTDDKACVLECSRHNAVMYSTFPVG